MSDVRIIVVAGAGGRMGRALVRAVTETPGCVLSGALEAKGHPDLGQDAGTLAGLKPLGVPLADDPLPLLAKAQALIDFTTPQSSVALAALSAQARIVHVIGT
ncbi:MAG TPA: 4-hydroxy-tetrahydrodipicolinate reductase, partial [Rhizomicrobium sp.]|nr:4-hydroxy-tetrahydrodipicolinate reductase [Rhizomicrobium sp.]